MTERPWCEVGSRGKPINDMGLYHLLKPFSISSTRSPGRTDRARGYSRDTFVDAWNRYLPAEPESYPSTRPHPSNGAGFDTSTSRPQPGQGGRVENGEKSSNGVACGRVDDYDSREDDDGEEIVI